MLHLDRIRILLSLSFTLSLSDLASLDRFSNEARSIHRSKKPLLAYIYDSRATISANYEITIEEREREKKENSIVEQRRSRLIGRAAPKKRYRGEDLSLHHRKPRSLGGKKNNLSFRGNPRGVRCSSVHGPVCLSLLARPPRLLFATSHLSFHHPLLLAYQPFQRSPRDARANRTNTYKSCIRSRKKKEEASIDIIYRVENIEKATKRDERQKEGAARVPSSSPSFPLHDPSPPLPFFSLPVKMCVKYRLISR